MFIDRRACNRAARRLAVALAFGGSIALLVFLAGTRDLESYEHAVFSLDRGTAVTSVQVLGQPVHTLALGFGVRLPLHGGLGASPAALLAPYLPAPLTYGLLLAFAIAAALLVVGHALVPECGRVVAAIAGFLLFCSVPVVNYTIYDDWPETAVTYCAFVVCAFAPHAILVVLDGMSSRTRRRFAAFSVAATVWALVALAHPGYWPLLAVTLVLTSVLALTRSEYRLRDRITGLAGLALVALAAVALPAVDILRELNAIGTTEGVRRAISPTQASLVSANAFPFGQVGARLPFSYLGLALVSSFASLAAPSTHVRRMILGAALMSGALAVAATTVSPSESLMYAPSNTWALRDPAGVFAVLSGAYAAAATLRSLSAGRSILHIITIAALAIAALQGPVYAATLVFTNVPESVPSWTRDMTAPTSRIVSRGLLPNRVAPGTRLALWPGAGDRMRNARRPSVDFADAGFYLVTAWTKQRTMRGLLGPNDLVFDQNTYLSDHILCDSEAVRFLQLGYLVRPEAVAPCAPWTRVADVRVDDWLEVDVVAAPDTRIRALPLARLAEPPSRRPALSADSRLLPMLVPLPGTMLTLAPPGIALRLDDPAVATGHVLVLPVAYDSAWQASVGQARNVGGLLALIGVDQRDVRLRFVPDLVAMSRALSMTLAQLLAVVGLLGLAFVGPVAADDPLARQLRTLWARLAASRPATALRQPHHAGHLAFTLAVGLHAVWTPEPAFVGLLFPIAALVVAGLARWPSLRRAGAALLLVLALGRVAVTGSQSATALHDPLFWAMISAIACGLTALAGRWPAVAAAAAAVAGATAMVATLLPVFPDFATVFPRVTSVTVSSGVGAFADQVGLVATFVLLSLWFHALASGLRASSPLDRTAAAASGALLAGLLLAAAGAVPPDGFDPATLLALGALLGLARANSHHNSESSEGYT